MSLTFSALNLNILSMNSKMSLTISSINLNVLSMNTKILIFSQHMHLRVDIWDWDRCLAMAMPQQPIQVINSHRGIILRVDACSILFDVMFVNNVDHKLQTCIGFNYHDCAQKAMRSLTHKQLWLQQKFLSFWWSFGHAWLLHNILILRSQGVLTLLLLRIVSRASIAQQLILNLGVHVVGVDQRF